MSLGLTMADPQARAVFGQLHATADFVYLWQDADVNEGLMYNLCQRYRTVRRFSAIADSRADLQNVMRTDFATDVATNADTRAKVAAVVCPSESSKSFIDREGELKAEQRALGTKRVISTGDKTILRKAVEAAHGKFPDKKCPAPEFVGLKLEEIEQGDRIASPIDAKRTCCTATLTLPLTHANCQGEGKGYHS